VCALLGSAVTVACSSGSHVAKPAPSVARATPATASPHPTPTASSDQLLFDAGSGDQTTDVFTAPGSWEIDSHYNCPTGEETFSAQIADPDGVPVLDPALTSVNDFGSAGDPQTQETKAGKFELQIMTDCDWTVVVRRI
jgi:hypothetical protein